MSANQRIATNEQLHEDLRSDILNRLQVIMLALESIRPGVMAPSIIESRLATVLKHHRSIERLIRASSLGAHVGKTVDPREGTVTQDRNGHLGGTEVMARETVTIAVELTDAQAWQLAQFLKRARFDHFRECATADDETYATISAANEVRKALANKGYEPR